jgi:cell division protein FtsL
MRRLGMFILLLIGFALVAALYVVKTRTQSAYQELVRLEKALAAEEAAIAVLGAEIAHLESPERLRALSEEYLDLRPTSASQMITLDDLVVRVPRRPEEAAHGEGGENE